jgi:Ser/Thr protein kinase RdoA (MazF antagonist)
MYDLACAPDLQRSLPDVEDLIAAWADGYRTVEPLDQSDAEEIPTFLMLRRLLVPRLLRKQLILSWPATGASRSALHGQLGDSERSRLVHPFRDEEGAD